MSNEDKITKVLVLFTGGKGKQFQKSYTGYDPVLEEHIQLVADHKKYNKVSVSEEKAFQLMNDFPDKFELVKGGEGVEKMLEDYNHRMISEAEKTPVIEAEKKKHLKGEKPSWNQTYEALRDWAKVNDVEFDHDPDKSVKENKVNCWAAIKDHLK
jgi:hypothetical protein